MGICFIFRASRKLPDRVFCSLIGGFCSDFSLSDHRMWIDYGEMLELRWFIASPSCANFCN
ncbi:hypothetical protein PL9214640307 [Planktothrix tepida PCC 9214]|uniref:Uncharacterized protein n=1 Tax=Planktothrix tepida PCC 9214 TaxID=671072 RepID=A0A1J1LR01_9CYAN|nr:hypothetical protein PL9214640307 [Planktothrix tepida PCC 9214]